jgi:hypothetical protein
MTESEVYDQLVTKLAADQLQRAIPVAKCINSGSISTVQ